MPNMPLEDRIVDACWKMPNVEVSPATLEVYQKFQEKIAAFIQGLDLSEERRALLEQLTNRELQRIANEAQGYADAMSPEQAARFFQSSAENAAMHLPFYRKHLLSLHNVFVRLQSWMQSL